MKVMHVIQGLNTGGAETLVKEYALKLDKSLFDVIVLCFEHCENSPYEKLLEENNIKVIYICDFMKYYHKKSLIFKIINKIERYLLIRRFINKENPKILHTHLLVNNYIKFAKPKKGTIIFHTVHGEPRRYWPSKKNSDYKAAKYLVEKYHMRFICLHEKMKNEVNEMFNVDNSIILNNGIDFARFENLIDSKNMRRELNIPEDSFVVGHIGRFDKVKNHELLVEIFYEIFNKKNNAFLLMIGGGVEKENIARKLDSLGLKNKFKILSNRTDVPNLLNTMDVFVFPSKSEGLGISLIEAQQVRLPCFISNTVPNHAIISNIITKIPLESEAKEWAKKILNYELPKEIKIDNKEWNINEIVRKLENLYCNRNI